MFNTSSQSEIYTIHCTRLDLLRLRHLLNVVLRSLDASQREQIVADIARSQIEEWLQSPRQDSLQSIPNDFNGLLKP